VQSHVSWPSRDAPYSTTYTDSSGILGLTAEKERRENQCWRISCDPLCKMSIDVVGDIISSTVRLLPVMPHPMRKNSHCYQRHLVRCSVKIIIKSSLPSSSIDIVTNHMGYLSSPMCNEKQYKDRSKCR
jgi:hypothetical protein